MEAYGRSALDSQIWTISVPRSTPRLYYNLDDRLGEAEHRRTPDFTKYQFDGHGLRRYYSIDWCVCSARGAKTIISDEK